jgi:hypothetical protein
MANYRLWPSTNGPSAALAFSGPIVMGVNFSVTASSCWFSGYYIWCCNSGQSTAPVKCALLSVVSYQAGVSVTVPGSVVTSATLIPGTWNYVPLASPVQLALGDTLIAAFGMNNAFPITQNYWTAGGPGVNGITNGPLVAYSDQAFAGGTNGNPAGLSQGLYSIAGNDPTTSYPGSANASYNGWIDVQITDTAPAGYMGSYRLFPNKAGPYPGGQIDNPSQFTLATEIHLSQTCVVNKIWFCSPPQPQYPAMTQLPTDVNIWAITGNGTTGTSIYHQGSLTWSGPPGSGFVSVNVSGLTLPPGSYKVSVFNGATTIPSGWSIRDLGFWGSGTWGSGPAVGGITWGPLAAPGDAAVTTTSYVYDAGGAGNNPPYQTGVTITGQGTFEWSGSNLYPVIIATGNSPIDPGHSDAENFHVDLEVTPLVIYPKFSTLVDNFASGLNSSVWQYSLGQVTDVAGQVNISSTTAAIEYQLFTTNFYDLTSSWVSIQLVNAGNQLINSWEVYPIMLQDRSGNRLYWYVIQGAIAAYKLVGGVQTQVFFATYNSAVHQWLRIRESAGSTYWEYSADGLTWIVGHSEADPITETALQMIVQAGQFAVETSTTTAIFDNINTQPTIWRLWSAAISGPSSPISYSGNFISGTGFTVTQSGMWFQGYWWWLSPTGAQPTGPTKCALWSQTNMGTGNLVPGSVVTSGPLTPGWNYIPLPQPIPLSLYDTLVAAVGCNGAFPDTPNYWGPGQTGGNGITQGPLMAWSAPGTSYWSGGHGNPLSSPQGLFSTAGSDPSLTMPAAGSSTDNFWVDVQVTDTAPTNYYGSWRLWPNRGTADALTQGDSAVPYVVGTEIDLSARCTLNRVWYYSPPGATTLATSADVWAITGTGTTGTNIATNAAPTWLLPSGATAVGGQGWMYCVMPATNLPAGKYRVSVYDANGATDSWSAKRLAYWGYSAALGSQGYNTIQAIATGGITEGPMTAPVTSAMLCYSYGVGAGANASTVTEPGQSVFWVGPPNAFPNQYVGANSPAGNLYQNYWVDMEATVFVPAIIGSAAVAIGALHITATAGVTVSGTAAVSIGPLNIMVAPSAVVIHGNANIVIAAPIIRANGGAVGTAQGSARLNLGGLTIRANGILVRNIIGSARLNLGPLTIVAAEATPMRAALLSHFLDTYVVPDVKNWSVENERFRHDQALYRYGEYAIFVTMWTMQDFTAGFVGRCQTCYSVQGAVESTWQQPGYFKCPDCLGTSFEGGYKAILVRPSLWSWNEQTLSQTARGVLDQGAATVQTTADFRLQPRDYIIRGDGSRWQSQEVTGDHLDTGFGTQAGIWNATAFIYQNVTREDESSPIYLLPITQDYIQNHIPEYYSRAPMSPS